MMEDADLLCPAGRRPRQADEAQMFGSPQAEPTPGGKDAVASLDALRVAAPAGIGGQIASNERDEPSELDDLVFEVVDEPYK